MDWIRSKSVIKDQKLKSKSKFDCVVTECDIYPVHVLCSQLQFAVCEFIHAPIILVVLEKGEGFFKPSDQGHACFWVCFLDGSENKV